MFKRLLSVGGFTLLSRITGFLRDILQAKILGAGVLSDAFVVAFLFPGYFRSIFGEGTVNPAFLPRYATLWARGEKNAAATFADRVFSWQMLVQVVFLVLAMAFMPAIMQFISPGFAKNAGQLPLTVSLARITFPYLILTVVAIQISAMLNAVERFWAAAAWSNFQNVAMIGTLLLSNWFPNAAYAAAWGVLISGFLQLFFMLWAGARHGISLRITWPRWTPEIKEFFVALGAVTIGAASVVIAPFIDIILASYLPAGSRTELYLADRMNQLPLGVLGIAIGTVLLPEMSAKLALNDRAGSDRAQNRSAALSLLFTLPFLAAFVAIPDTIMRAVFVRGHFTTQDALMSAIGLSAYGFGLPAMALVRVFGPSFYARHDTKTPARITVAAVIVNIAVKFALVQGLGMGIAGLALGTSIGAWVNVGLLVFIARKRDHLRLSHDFWGALVPIVLAAAGTAAAAYAAVHIGGAMLQLHLFMQQVLLAMAIVASGVVYGTIVLIFRKRLPLGRLAGR
jgi:putative peptidoglycan lipid II flippase